MAQALIWKVQAYKMNLPADLEEGRKRYVLDPQQGRQMVLKLLDLLR